MNPTRVRLLLAQHRLEQTRDEFRRRTAGLMETSPFRFYTEAELRAGEDRLVADLQLERSDDE